MFHESNPSLFGRPQGVLAETENVRSLLFALHRVSVGLLGESAHAIIEARRLLANLSAKLSVYFDMEEARSYFDTIVTERPGLGDRVTEVGEAREALQSSVTSVRRFAFRDTDSAELGRRIQAVVLGFEAQERSETDLLQTFFHEEARRPRPELVS